VGLGVGVGVGGLPYCCCEVLNRVSFRLISDRTGLGVRIIVGVSV
jgi:hypothetical protein